MLLKLKLNVLVIFKVDSDGMICVYVNPMSLFIILLSLTISSASFESDLTLSLSKKKQKKSRDLTDTLDLEKSKI